MKVGGQDLEHQQRTEKQVKVRFDRLPQTVTLSTK